MGYVDLYDLRPSDQYKLHHIQDAVNIPDPMNFDKFSEEYNLPIVLYGDSDIMTNKVCNHLFQIAKSQNKEQRMSIFKANYSDFYEKYSFLCETETSQNEQDEDIEEKEAIFYPAMIQNRLYVGDLKMAQTQEIIKNLKVTHILNLTKCESKLDKKRIKYLQIKIDDSSNESISVHFSKASNFIYRALDENKENVVFVHCMTCSSVSPCVIVAYLINSKGDSLIDSYLYTKKCLPKMSPNRGFYNELIEHEKNLLDTSTGNELENALNSKQWTFNYFQGTWDMS